MTFTYDNRTKYESNGVYVSRNHEYTGETSSAVFILTGSAYTNGASVPTSTAREIAAALIEAADEFDAAVEEANKPKLPTEPGLYVAGNATNASLWTEAIVVLSEDGRWSYWDDASDAPIEDIFKYNGGLKRLLVEGE